MIHSQPHSSPKRRVRLPWDKKLMAACLRNGERAPLRWPHRAERERNPVNLVLEDSRNGAVLLRADPHVRLRPLTQRAQLLNLRARSGRCWLPNQLHVNSGYSHAHVM